MKLLLSKNLCARRFLRLYLHNRNKKKDWTREDPG